ncbi:MAG TPA: shikimate kinase [Bacteroidales bacterium]|nr:shikimate kinase [Bacteroidales bacterium]HRZ76526.1 shikimate kinase [Bacteroidales bacterium]
MGSGKSTIGPMLADRLGVPFLETDQVVEMTLGLSIPEIFEKHGEQMFRDAESMALRTTVMLPEGVIALGGGTPCSEDAQAFLSQDCLTIYLQAPAVVLAKRLKGRTWDRPLFSGLKEEQHAAYITSLLEQREPWYLRAGLVVHTQALSPDQVVDVILNHIVK